MKRLSFIILLLFICVSASAQGNNFEDSLKQIIDLQKGDTSEVKALCSLAFHQRQTEAALSNIQKALLLAQKLKYKKGEADCYIVKAMVLYVRDKDISGTIQNLINALNIYKHIDYMPGVVAAHGGLQGSYRDIGDYGNALSHAFEGLRQAKANNLEKGTMFMEGRVISSALSAEISQTYLLMNQLDSAKLYAEKSISEREFINGAQWNFPVYLLATIRNLQGHHKEALNEYRDAIPLAIQNEFFHDTLQIFSGMSTAFRNLGLLDSSLYYASVVVQSQNPEREIKTYLESLTNLAASYKLTGNKDSALKYLELTYTNRDSLLGKEKERIIQGITFTEKLKQQEFISAQEKYKSRLQVYILVGGVFVLLLITGLLWRNNRQKQKAKTEIEKAYSELKSTQAQLIQSEKMASLGELTAGIAHEIQNPLNFVNNFSDVNKELLEELKAEANKTNIDEVKAIADDVIQNEDKINYHGKRADAIVKSMLQHSRSSSGQKEPTDINVLCDEYLRLAYHGLRAKDKSFNAKFETGFDNSIGKINVVPQEIGRVILNLINNAFYTVDEKKKRSGNDYEPIVTIATRSIQHPLGDRRIQIKVSDNGGGIPQKILDKIFQPFFTTKPTGQGTGLGLSLAYDIITKGHGGELKVETKEGEGSEFIITL